MNFVSRDSGFTDLASSFTKVETSEQYHGEVLTPSSRYRRPGNLSYFAPGSIRNEFNRTPRSVTRSLVMVLPPAAVAREHGSGLYLNSQSRGPNAVLMPLLPSLSNQLTAIAREFSFPSTAGICIYLQMFEGGVTFAPRITDESWSILWGSVFDDRQPAKTLGGHPIAGRIEFDLDLRKAKWFDLWISSIRKDVEYAPSAVPSGLPRHAREESRTSFTNDAAEESLTDNASVTIQKKVPIIRHVPRKLSLLDRVDVSALKAIPHPVSRTLSPKMAEQIRSTPSLSPDSQNVMIPVMPRGVTDDDEPQTAIQRVEKKVQNWRASSNFAKSPLVATTGQTALDPANMPNNVPLDTVTDVEVFEPLNLDDFTWSISSAGPLSADFVEDTQSDWRAPSIHIDARAEGSVCLTPTTCTSFGPPDYDVWSPVSSLISRLPSPDIAARQLDDCPPTPSTATSWGPPLEWPDSPISQYRALSVDLGTREYGSRPVTPSTATSWGAPLEWPESPMTPFYVHTPGVGNMFFDDEEEESALLRPGRVLRSYGAGDKEPHELELESGEGSSCSRPWKMVWPYRREEEIVESSSPGPALGTGDKEPCESKLESDESVSTSRPWKLVWPYRHSSESVEAKSVFHTRLVPKYPCIDVYPAAYPHFDIYPTVIPKTAYGDSKPPRKQLEAPKKQQSSKVVPWRGVWPYQKSFSFVQPVDVRLTPEYPSLIIYPAAYPHFDLYPVLPEVAKSDKGAIVTNGFQYPFLDIYPAVYPHFDLYPSKSGQLIAVKEKEIVIKLDARYPSLDIYPAVYPNFDLYPAKAGELKILPESEKHMELRHISIKLETTYPGFNIYPAVYPHFDLYPSIPEVKRNVREIDIRLEASYPRFNLYPAVYPYFNLYNSSPEEAWIAKDVVVKLETKYPSFNIYPTIYPSFEIYPGDVIEPQVNIVEALSVRLAARYPSFEIYAPFYPCFVIYPEVPGSVYSTHN